MCPRTSSINQPCRDLKTTDLWDPDRKAVAQSSCIGRMVQHKKLLWVFPRGHDAGGPPHLGSNQCFPPVSALGPSQPPLDRPTMGLAHVLCDSQPALSPPGGMLLLQTKIKLAALGTLSTKPLVKGDPVCSKSKFPCVLHFGDREAELQHHRSQAGWEVGWVWCHEQAIAPPDPSLEPSGGIRSLGHIPALTTST